MKINRCTHCLCECCTRFRCPYRLSKCERCFKLDFKRTIDCDFFENKATAPKRFKIKRKRSSNTDMINTKLDYIIANMGLSEPIIDIDGTFDVMFGNIIAGRFYNRRLAVEYVEKFQSAFSKRLEIRRVEIDI